jgi:glycosyltransferase-like protein
MLSIGIFTYSTRPRGSVVHATYLAEALQRRGQEVTLYCLSKAGDELYRQVSCRVVLLRAEAAPSDPDELIRQRISEISAGLELARPQHDLCHAEDCLMASGLLDAAATCGSVPIVRTLHHLEHYTSEYLSACQRRSLLESDAVACVSRVSQRDVLREIGRLCPIIGNGVDTSRFDHGDLARQQAWYSELGIEADHQVVLGVGGVEPRKNSLRALDALGRLLGEQQRLHYVIAGGASIWEHAGYRDEFARKLALLPPAVRARVHELGPLAERDLTALYGLADVLLCPSTQEGFGLCVLEALAAKTPVVVSRGEPFTEYLDEGCASFVDPSDVDDITSAVRTLLLEPELRRRRAASGLQRAKLYDWERVASAHEDLYAAVLSKQRLRPTSEEAIHA